MKAEARWLSVAVLALVALVWSTPLMWMLIAAFRPQNFGGLDMASLWPDFAPTLSNFREALASADFARLYLNTIIVTGGILIVQLVTATLAGFAFARLRFPGSGVLFVLFLMQLMIVTPVLIVPNLVTITRMGLYDTLLAVMAPYFGSAFGVFLMRQTFRTIPRDFEEAAVVEGANWLQLIWRVLLPLARPGMVAFAIISVTTHWNEFLWPLMVISNPDHQTLTIGFASFTRGAESASQWGVIAAGTFLVAAPLMTAFVLFQRQFVNSFLFSGVK
jgi:sn-glycerol 3-phosphate transport system permease protein